MRDGLLRPGSDDRYAATRALEDRGRRRGGGAARGVSRGDGVRAPPAARPGGDPLRRLHGPRHRARDARASRAGGHGASLLRQRSGDGYRHRRALPAAPPPARTRAARRHRRGGPRRPDHRLPRARGRARRARRHGAPLRPQPRGGAPALGRHGADPRRAAPRGELRRTAWQTEEAEIAETLVRVGETLGAHLDRPDIVEWVNRLAVEALGCDWSSTFLFDERRGVYWLAANVGSRPEVRTELAQLEFAPESLPLLERFQPGTLVEIPDASTGTLVPAALMRRTEAASALYAPIARGEKIIGVLVNGYRERTGPFSRRQRRLALGIAHASAIALENGRLIADLQAASRLKS